MLLMLLPTMVPIPMSVCPFFIAVIDVTSSGSDVPMATMVIPITVSDIPMPCAINTTFSIVRYPPRYRSPEPIAISPAARGTDHF